MIPQKIGEFMTKWFGESWKTTVIGILGAAVPVVIPVLQGGKPTAREIALAFVIGLLGYFSKDHK